MPENDKSALRHAVWQQPVSVAIDAATYYFHSYRKGVLSDAAACGTSLDHAGLAVGYGHQDGFDYYLLKNSWGPDWGDHGYVKVAADDTYGVCGVQKDPGYPNV